MKKKSLFSRLNTALRDNDDLSDEDIVRDVESSVQAIKDAEVQTLCGNDVFSVDWGEAGDMVYIMNLGPIYEIIGGRTGRMSTSLQEACENAFSRMVGHARGKAYFEGDKFFMRFTNKTPSEDFNLAASVINEVGTFILYDRFKTLEIPGLMVATAADDITNEDGSLNMERVEAVVESGGAPISIDAPSDGSPNWMVHYWNGLLSKGGEYEKSGDIPDTVYNIIGNSDPLPEHDPKWQEIQSDKNGPNKEQIARGKERRTKKKSFFIGVEKRVKSSGRREYEKTNEMIW